MKYSNFSNFIKLLKKSRQLYKIVLSGLLLILASCSIPARPMIELAPQVKIIPSSIGQGQSVALSVIDNRQQTDSSARIDPQQNTAQIFKTQLTQGLEAKGFNLETMTKNQLTLQILSIDYRTLSGYVSTNTQTFVSAKVKAQNNTGFYIKTYNASAYNDNYLSAVKQTPSEQVNIAVSKLLSNIINDPVLIQFLAEKP